MTARRAQVIEVEAMTSGDDVVGENNSGAGIPEDWIPMRTFAGRFGHGQSQSAARNWWRRQLAAGLVREWREVGRDRYVTEDEIERFRERWLEQTRRSLDSDPDA